MEIWNVRNIYINSREGRRTWCVENRCNTPYRNRGGIAHTLTCRDGALCVQHCNLIIEVEKLEDIKQLGKLEEGSSQRRIVYDSEYSSPTLQAAMGAGGGNIPLTIEQNIVAMRGRNPENPSDRTKGIKLEQKLEPNSQGLCNTLTSVQKDNLVLEQASLRMVRTEEGKALRKQYESGEIHHGFNEYREAEPRQDGVSNTITTVQKDNIILEKSVVAIDEQNKCIRTETFGTLTTDGSSPKHNNRVGEIKKIKIRQATKQGFIECEIGGAVDLDYPSSQTRRARVIEEGKLSPTLTTENIPNVIELGNPDFYNFLYEIDGEIYLIRIRKLIPLECWRLMGFTDEDFYKAEKVNSNTQLYKQAGNSIVCNCLEAIFSQMNIKGVTAWNEKQKELAL